MKIPLLSHTLAKAFLLDSEDDYLYQLPPSKKKMASASPSFSPNMDNDPNGSNDTQCKALQDNELFHDINKQKLFFGYIEKFNGLIPGKIENYYQVKITGFNDGVIASLNENILVYEIIDEIVTLECVINLAPKSLNTIYVLHMESHVSRNGREFLYALLSSQEIVLICLNTSTIISRLKLKVKDVKRFTLLTIEDTIALVLHGTTSTSSIITHTPLNKLYESLPINLPFWSVGAIKLSRFYIYIFSPKGKFSIYRYGQQTHNLIKANRNQTLKIHKDRLGDSNYGAIKEIRALEQDIWVVCQEYGWTLYEINGGLINYVISSPLSSSFRKFLLGDGVKGVVMILMDSGDIMVVNAHNVNIVKSELGLIDAFALADEIIGCFRINHDDNIFMKKLDNNSLSWNKEHEILLCSFSGSDGNRYYKEFDEFIVENKEELIITLKKDGYVLNSLGRFGYIHEVLDITPLLGLMSQTLVVIGESPNLTILQMNANLTWVLKRFSCSDLHFKSLSLIDESKYLLIDDRIIVDLNTLTIENSLPSSISALNTLEIFRNEGKLAIDDVVKTYQDCILDNTTVFVPFDVLTKDSHLIEELRNILDHDGDKIFEFIAVDTSSDSISFVNTRRLQLSNCPMRFPFLLTLLIDSNNENNETLLQYHLENFGYDECYRVLSAFCFSSNSSISELAFNVLDQLLDLFQLEASLIVSEAQSVLSSLEFITSEGEVDLLYSTLVVGLVSSHNSSLLTDPNISKPLVISILNFITSENAVCVSIMLQLLGKLTFPLIKKKVINPAGLLSAVFDSRETYMRKNPHMKLFTAFNQYLNTVMKSDPSMTTVLLGYLLTKDDSTMDLQSHVLDYINYFLIEFPFEFNANDLFVTLISLIYYFAALQDHHEQNKRLLDTLSLTSNILTTNFHICIGSYFKLSGTQLQPAELLSSAQHEGKICICLDNENLKIGYSGVVLIRDTAKHNKHHQKNWHIKYLKYQKGALKGVLQRHLDHVKEFMGTTSNLSKPVFSSRGTCIACFNFTNYSILIYDLNKVEIDLLDSEVLKNNSISVMIPKFGPLFIQSYWKLNDFTKRYHNVQLSKVFEVSDSEFIEDSGSERTCCKLIHEISIVDLMFKYLSVFPDITLGDLKLDWMHDGRIELSLQGKTIFVFNLDDLE